MMSPQSMKNNGASTTSSSKIDSFSAELSRLTVEERSHALNELHGVSEKKHENPEMIESKVQMMRHFLSIIVSKGGEGSSAYKKAKKVDSNYVDGLKLRFLRADGYNSHEAAKRMMRFFERKRELFGEDKLGREIQLQDLNEHEHDALKKGLVQLLPIRDQAGRAILFFHGQIHEQYACTKSVMRVIFYFMMATLRDSESQINGTVLVSYGLGQKKIIPGRMSEFLKSWESIPWRFAACHYCKEQQQFGILQPVVKILANSLHGKALSRFRLHTGSHMEILFNLMTFGIPKDAIPVEDDGRMGDLSYHHNVLGSLGYVTTEDTHELVVPMVVEERDSSSGSSTETTDREPVVTLVLGPVDVLMGRGRHPKSSPGALRLHNFLLDYKGEYEAAGRDRKTEISKKILQKMKDMGSRFMTSTTSGYVECADSVARAKIAHGFRNLRLKYNNKNSRDSASNPQTNKKMANKRTLS